MPKEYPAEFKTKIIKRYQKGESIQSLSQELHIAQSTLYDWRREYCSIKTANRTYTPKEFDTLSRRLEKLEHELEIIRLTGYISNVPLQKKLVFLESLYQKPDNPYSVYELCEALDVARGTFYNHIFRRADRSKRDQEQARLMRLVQQVFDDSAQRFGAEKIRIALAESGIRVSTKRIAAIMQELDLHSIRPDAKKQFKKRQQYKKQNLLEQQFTAERPNQIWVSDVTCFKLGEFYLYTCVILDLFSRKIVAYKVSRKNSTQLITSTFKMAWAQRNPETKLIFHSDRGAQYTSHRFKQLLHEHAVVQSFSNSGRPHDNAVAESFFATLKKEELYRKDYTSETDFKRCLASYIEFYNTQRPHRTLKNRTPCQVEELFMNGK